MDLSNGYWQIPLAVESKKDTAFSHPQRKFYKTIFVLGYREIQLI